MMQPGSNTTGRMPELTIADQVATAPFTVDSMGLAWVPLFTDLTLLPGSYFLVLSADSPSDGWGDTDTRDNPTSITAPGVTYNGSFGTSIADPFPPAAFSPLMASLDNSNFVALEFDVTGNAVPAPVPEPATLALLSVGLAGIGLVGRKQRSPRSSNSSEVRKLTVSQLAIFAPSGRTV
jgi:hypothetical protein